MYWWLLRADVGTTPTRCSVNVDTWVPLLVLGFLCLILLGMFVIVLLRMGRARAALEVATTAAAQSSQTLESREAECRSQREELSELREQKATLTTKLQVAEQRLAEERQLWSEMKGALSDQFKALAAETLQSSQSSLLKSSESILARYQDETATRRQAALRDMGELIKPVRDALDKVETNVRQLEKQREGAYQGLYGQVESLMRLQGEWAQEVTKLSSALRSPVVRGKWGELQLKRVVELAGLQEYCDFIEQTSFEGENGRLRPDMIVRLPEDRDIIIDAKTPLTCYFEAMATDNEDQARELLKNFAVQLRRHVTGLGQKNYWSQFESSPEFVVLFLPGDHYYASAMQVDPSLLELGANFKVIIATPTTLIGLLRAVAYGWRQEALAENAKHISSLGSELYGRIADFSRHIADVGKGLNQAVESYNKSLFSIDHRILSTAKKLEKWGAKDAKKQVRSLAEVDASCKKLKMRDELEGATGI